MDYPYFILTSATNLCSDLFTTLLMGCKGRVLLQGQNFVPGWATMICENFKTTAEIGMVTLGKIPKQSGYRRYMGAGKGWGTTATEIIL